MTYCSYQDKILPFLRPVGSKRQGRAALNSKILNYVTFPRFANSDLRFSSKDFEKLWFLYQTEGVPEEESINSFCEKNGVPYEEFDKWFRKTHQAVGRVEIENIPDDEPMLKSSRRREHKSDPEGIQVTIQTSDGLHLRKNLLPMTIGLKRY